MSDLRVLNALPEGLLQAHPNELQDLLGAPTLIHLAGEQEQPLFVSTLLHGNETTGFLALQTLLREYIDRPLPRALSLLVGNVAAAAAGQRSLAGQPDYNRIWPDAQGQVGSGVPADMAALSREVVSIMRQRQLFAALDLHNTSGRNPPHACVNAMRADCLALAGGFAHRVLYFTRPTGVLCMAFTPWCPAVTVECGPVGTVEGLQLTRNFLEHCLHLPSLDGGEQGETQIYRSVARVELQARVSVAVAPESADLQLVMGIDGYNWRELPEGTVLARGTAELSQLLQVQDPEGGDVCARYLQQQGTEIHTRQPLTPAMLTLEADIIRQDCLCYFLERVC